MSTPSRIVVLYAHPTPQRSRVNRSLADIARAMPGVHLQDLYQTYPDFYIDAPAERELIDASDLLVFLHPIRWYSMPSLLKEWVDVVFEPDWAYERNRGALAGKSFWLVASTGSGEEAYQSAVRADRRAVRHALDRAPDPARREPARRHDAGVARHGFSHRAGSVPAAGEGDGRPRTS
jgi:putative NADPH-quinone reductase